MKPETRYRLDGARIDARAAWQGDTQECQYVYWLFVNVYGGRFHQMRADRRWKRASLLSVLRRGRP